MTHSGTGGKMRASARKVRDRAASHLKSSSPADPASVNESAPTQTQR
jgi:hypothetical protein